MNRFFVISWILMLTVFPSLYAFAQDQPIRFDFSGNSVQANGVTVQGAGFGAYPQADISFGNVPTDNAFAGATDGKGAIIQARPGEGIMIFFPPMKIDRAALIRASVRTGSNEASVYLASIDQGENQFVSTITPNNGAFFLNHWKRITDFCLPPSTGFQLVLQITNVSKTKPLTAYVDNVEIYRLEKGRYYSEEFLNGDEIDPKIISTVPSEAATPTPTPEDTLIITLPNLPADAKLLELVLIPAGTFTMGSPDNERGRGTDEGPQHLVTLTKDFYLGKYEVTQAQWQAVMNNNPSYFVGRQNNPVEEVTWYDCAKFCNAVSLREDRTPVYNESDWSTNWNADGYRLPTEAEWEYACRANTMTRFSFGDALECSDYFDFCTIADQYMWWWGNDTYNGNVYGTNEVKKKLANPWGLFDMHGNIWEWCNDWYGSYNQGNQTDPQGPSFSASKILRGGSWNGDARNARSADRSGNNPDYRYNFNGLRLARTK